MVENHLAVQDMGLGGGVVCDPMGKIPWRRK